MVPRSNGYKKWWRKIKGRLEHNRDEKVVVVEIGCGKRIPTVRQNSERIIRSCPMGQARLMRINPGQRKQKRHTRVKQRPNTNCVVWSSLWQQHKHCSHSIHLDYNHIKHI